MTRFDMFQKAIEQLGTEIDDATLIEFFKKHFRVNLDPKHVAILWATRRGQDALREARANAAQILAEVEKEKPVKKRRKRAPATEEETATRG